jgi:chemotaxis protein CheC
MGTYQSVLSEEQLDFLREMMSIGAGNAAGALEQILGCRLEMEMPKLHIIPIPLVGRSIRGDPTIPVMCAKMGLLGDIRGDVFFIVPDLDLAGLIDQIKEATPGGVMKGYEMELSVVTEVANIVSGVYLTALHDFCLLNIYHTVPKAARDMIQSLLDESLAKLCGKSKEILLVVNEFAIDKMQFVFYFLMITSPQSIETFAASIEEARKAYGAE